MGMGLFYRMRTTANTMNDSRTIVLKLKSSNIEITTATWPVMKGEMISIYNGATQAITLRCDSDMYMDDRGRTVVDVSELATVCTNSYPSIDIPNYI